MKLRRIICLMLALLSVAAVLFSCEEKPPVTEGTTEADTTEKKEDDKPKNDGFYGLKFERPITVAAYGGSGSAYSRMYVLKDGRIICAWPSTDGGKRCMKAVFSEDDGKTWSKIRVLFYGEDQTKTLANVDIIQLESGQVLMAYRSNDREASGGYSSIRIHASDDNCETFYPHSIVCELQQTGLKDGVSWGLWEPDFCYVNGKLTCFFAIGKTVYKEPVIPSTDIFEWDEAEKKWVQAHYTSNDTGKTDRNGMPIVDKLSTGGYLMTVETKRFYSARGSTLLPYLLYSADGVHWKGVTGCFFPENTASGGSPYWVELPDGRIVVAFQTDEDVEGTIYDTGDDKCKVTKIVVSNPGVDITKAHSWDWSESYDPFNTSLGSFGNWPGMFIHNDYLYIYTSTNDPIGSIELVRAYVGDMKK
ncbi:MAG: exo-alpha-sialidase [Ruminococcaceae bacterium]|nr:exo-alpha-sialidase [Oscillospiraceae bacterium]